MKLHLTGKARLIYKFYPIIQHYEILRDFKTHMGRLPKKPVPLNLTREYVEHGRRHLVRLQRDLGYQHVCHFGLHHHKFSAFWL